MPESFAITIKMIFQKSSIIVKKSQKKLGFDGPHFLIEHVDRQHSCCAGAQLPLPICEVEDWGSNHCNYESSCFRSRLIESGCYRDNAI